jgi:hypothetical protein
LSRGQKATVQTDSNSVQQTNVNGPGQFIWAIVSYGIAAVAYTCESFPFGCRFQGSLLDADVTVQQTVAPSEVWGVAVMQNLNAHCFIVAGMIRVMAGAETGAMAKYMTQFLWPQALGFVFIMSPAILAPQWSKASLSRRAVP